MHREVGAIVLAVGMAAGVARAAVRPPAVAGGFYPAEADALRSMVDGLLAKAPEGPRAPRAIIVPHAGYVFSGAVAAEAFRGWKGVHARRLILLGPSHHMGFEGAALPAEDVTGFATPLGVLPLDRGAVARLRRASGFDGPPEAHQPEHSLEVELPFVQRTLGKVPIVPILVGPRTSREQARDLARALAPLLGPDTLVVASSDFTHHGASYGYQPFPREGLGERLVRLGRATAGRAAAVDPLGFWEQVEVSGDTVCGRHPVEVLLQLLAHTFEGTGTVLHVTTSGNVSGEWSRCVTYAAVAYEGSWGPWRDDPAPPKLGRLSGGEKRALLELARATLETHTAHGPELAGWFAGHRIEGNLVAIAGAFVTLKHRGRPEAEALRACMGSIVGVRPLAEQVIRSAVMAAHDPRFPELEAGELPGLVLEISVLSPLHRVPGPEAIRLGTHGVVLRKGRHGAVYLPQVATETGWDLETFLSHLAVKAGLPPDGWRHGARFEVFTAQVFSEEDLP